MRVAVGSNRALCGCPGAGGGRASDDKAGGAAGLGWGGRAGRGGGWQSTQHALSGGAPPTPGGAISIPSVPRNRRPVVLDRAAPARETLRGRVCLQPGGALHTTTLQGHTAAPTRPWGAGPGASTSLLLSLPSRQGMRRPVGPSAAGGRPLVVELSPAGAVPAATLGLGLPLSDKGDPGAPSRRPTARRSTAQPGMRAPLPLPACRGAAGLTHGQKAAAAPLGIGSRACRDRWTAASRGSGSSSGAAVDPAGPGRDPRLCRQAASWFPGRRLATEAEQAHGRRWRQGRQHIGRCAERWPSWPAHVC